MQLVHCSKANGVKRQPFHVHGVDKRKNRAG
ncbi:Uncharacterised protein [Vibrio cholerae]|nr:Uncharacterised protein [Vibrio cholerae]